MDLQATVFPSERHARLAELGLAESQLLSAVGQGLMARASCTENDAAAYPGFVAWGTTVRSLREELATSGWWRSEDGVSLVVNDGGDVAILVASGDNGTGYRNRAVSTKRGRGPKTSEQVQINRGQLHLFSPSVPTPAIDHIDQSDNRQVWMLLYHHDLQRREVRSELSLPISMGDDARPDG